MTGGFTQTPTELSTAVHIYNGPRGHAIPLIPAQSQMQCHPLHQHTEYNELLEMAIHVPAGLCSALSFIAHMTQEWSISTICVLLVHLI